MLLIRRLWLAPALFFCVAFYYLFLRSHERESYYGSVHWEKKPERNPVSGLAKLPVDGTAIPRIQFDARAHSESPAEKAVREERKQNVKDAFAHAWTGYKKHAFGKDEVMPLSGSFVNSFGGWGATLVDAMDTLWIMGMEEEFKECVDKVMAIDFTTNTEKDLNVFETTIRYLGGILAAYEVSEGKYPQLLDKAKELGEILYSAFDTPNRMPVCRWNWRKSVLGGLLEAADFTLLAELGSLSLEFTRLTQLTQDERYYDAIERISKLLDENQDKTLIPGLWPTVVNARDLKFDMNHFTMGGMADSTYEYLPKQHMLLNGADQTYRKMYEKALEAAKKYLFFKPLTPTNADILFSGTAALDSNSKPAIDPQGQHLTCFIAGMVGIASRIFSHPSDLTTARQLLDGCIWAYNSTPSGLMPETFHLVPCAKPTASSRCEWDDDTYYGAVAARSSGSSPPSSDTVSSVEIGKQLVKQNGLLPGFTAHGDSRYILRPEAIESVFILYRITGERRYQEDAWRMWESIEQATKTEIAHAAVVDVRDKHPEKSDRMESFWLAETLKYFYLVFSAVDVLSLDEWVLNTEAHPFRRPKPVVGEAGRDAS